MLLAPIAFTPLPALAHPPGGGGGGGGGGRGGFRGGVGVGIGIGRPGFYGGGYYNGYYNDGYAQPYVVQSPIIDNPAPAGSGLPIKIVNPAANKTTLSYTLDGNPYTIAPGSGQDLTMDHPWVIEFNRGGNFGQARYGLESGLYTFTSTDHGWELFQQPLSQSGPAMAPSNPLPSSNVPANPLPSPTPPAPSAGR
jgi:hypothetical protein